MKTWIFGLIAAFLLQFPATIYGQTPTTVSCECPKAVQVTALGKQIPMSSDITCKRDTLAGTYVPGPAAIIIRAKAMDGNVLRIEVQVEEGVQNHHPYSFARANWDNETTFWFHSTWLPRKWVTKENRIQKITFPGYTGYEEGKPYKLALKLEW